MTTGPSNLHASVLASWDRAVHHSLAEDLGHEFVALVLPLLPDAAPELLRLLAGHPGYHEQWLLKNHAPLLWRHARTLFLERLAAAWRATSPVEIFAKIAREAPPEERDDLRTRVMAFLEKEPDAMPRARALLAWAPHEPADRRAAMIGEAFTLAMLAEPGVARTIVGAGSERFDAAQRAELATIARRPDAEVHAAAILAMLARAAAREGAEAEALTHAREALEYRRRGARDLELTIYGLCNAVSFDFLRPWAEPWIRAIADRRTLVFATHTLAPHAPPDILDLFLERADAIDVEIWARAEIVADVSRHHAARRSALVLEVRDALDRIVGDPTLGHRMGPEDVPAGANVVVLQSLAVARASPILGNDAHRPQARFLATLVEMPSDYTHRHELGRMPWEELGAALVPALRADAVRAVLSLRHRPSALKALGLMAARFPEESRHLGLDGLSRLADTSPPETMDRTLQALEAAHRRAGARRRSAASSRKADSARRPASDWARADERSLAALTTFLSSGEYITSHPLRPIVDALTPAAAARAVEHVLAIQSPTQRATAMLTLARAPRIGARERDDLLAAALELIAHERGMLSDLPALARDIADVCGDGDPVWSDRVARFFDALAIEREPYLDLIEAFARLLRRLGGPELVAALASKLRAPLPTPEFARPWTMAARGSFEA